MAALPEELHILSLGIARPRFFGASKESYV